MTFRTGFPGQTLGHSLDEWLKGRIARREIADTTARTYRYSLEGFAEFMGRDTALVDIGPHHIEAWLSAQRTSTGRDLAAGSLNARAAPVRAFFRWATERRLIAVNPTVGVGRARVRGGEVRRLSDETVRRLFLVADFRTTVVILLGVSMGLRAVETARAAVSDWERSTELLRVHGKGDWVRYVPVPAEVADALAIWLDGRRSGPLLPSQGHGGHLGAARVSGLITAAARRAGVKATHHQLRHTYATRLVLDGVPLPVVQQLLGHRSLTPTTVYTRSTAAEIADHVPAWRWVL